MTTIVPNEQYGIGTNVPLAMKEIPVGVTLAKIGSKLMVDPSLDEEAVCETKLTIVSSSDGSVAGMQKMGPAPFTEAEVAGSNRYGMRKGSRTQGTLPGRTGKAGINQAGLIKYKY